MMPCKLGTTGLALDATSWLLHWLTEPQGGALQLPSEQLDGDRVHLWVPKGML